MTVIEHNSAAPVFHFAMQSLRPHPAHPAPAPGVASLP
jgi:hypothetical protein